MKKIKQPYQAPKVKVVSFKVEGGFVPSVDNASLVTRGQSNPQYERFEVSFGGNSGNNGTSESHF